MEMHTPHATHHAGERGFTLVEMIVAVALFAVVMLISITALLSLIDANRKAQALQSVMNNLSIALDGMVRAVRMGSNYRCNVQSAAPGSSADCADGGTVFYFTPFGADPSDTQQDWVYSFAEDGNGIGRMYRSEKGLDALAITAPAVSVDSMSFYVVGTERGDTTQPRVVIGVKGTAGVEKVKTRTTFNIQATAVQRLLDL
jgi:prepilin-type N-terminal cleavage/methylation domain-containing protein